MKATRSKRRSTLLALAASISLLAGGCAGLSQTEQRVLSGGAIGAGLGTAGAVIVGGPLIVGAALGAGAGAVGGYVVDELRLF